jgi:hypothetical protein
MFVVREHRRAQPQRACRNDDIVRRQRHSRPTKFPSQIGGLLPEPAGVLVDSCVFIGLLREGRDPIAELTQRVPLDQLATCGMIRLEVIRRISQPKARRILEDFMDVMLCATTDRLQEPKFQMRCAGVREVGIYLELGIRPLELPVISSGCSMNA